MARSTVRSQALLEQGCVLDDPYRMKRKVELGDLLVSLPLLPDQQGFAPNVVHRQLCHMPAGELRSNAVQEVRS
jgi:hypothetical protein